MKIPLGGVYKMDKSKLFLSCLITIVLTTAAPAGWVPLTGDPVSISSLSGGVLVVHDKEFSEFDLFGIGTGGALAPDATSVFVQGGKISGTENYGLRFLLGWNAGSNQTVTISSLSFKVSIMAGYDEWFIEDASMYLTAASATGTGVVNISQAIWDEPFGSVLASLSGSKEYLDGGAYLTASANFAQVKDIWVSSGISITGGTGGTAYLGETYLLYSQIPEPATVFLLGLGALALLRKRRQ